MTTSTSGAGSGSVLSVLSPPEFREYLVKRDKDRPLSFEGQRLAHASTSNSGGLNVLAYGRIEGAVYRTRGGKFITSLSKISLLAPATVLTDDQPTSPGGYNKAEVHDSFEEAMGWFKPGRITDEIRRQLGLDKPLRIE